MPTLVSKSIKQNVNGFVQNFSCTSIDLAIDVIDVVILVNYIIGETDFNDFEFYSADLNSDQVINVLDVVSLVNLILY